MNPCLYRIATTLAGLEKGSLFARHLPPPDLPTFADYSVKTGQAQGGEARHGWAQCSIFWDGLTAEQANIIKGLILEAEVTPGVGSGTLYLTIPRVDAGFTWIDVSGIAVMPEWQVEQRTDGTVYRNIELRLQNVVIETSPSSAI